MRSMRLDAARQGFSLIEALVVLAIGGMALAIIFSIGVKTGDTGFKLGRKAMSAADEDIFLSDFRSTVRSIALRPVETSTAALDLPIVGRPDRLEVDIVMERATGCAPAGFAGRISLNLERYQDKVSIICRAGARRAVFAVVSDPNVKLSYSEDGIRWSDEYTSPPRPAFSSGNGVRSISLIVRLTIGSMDVLEMATSGRPEAWIRFDDPI